MVIREGRMNEKRLIITNKRISYHNCYTNIIIMAQLLTDDTLIPSFLDQISIMKHQTRKRTIHNFKKCVYQAAVQHIP